MSQQKPNWTYNEFLAYLLLYAANADFTVKKEEKAILFSKVDKDVYKTIRKAFEKANDYKQLQTIISFREEYYNDIDSKDRILKDLKDIFLADEEYTTLERAIFTGLRRILNIVDE